MSEQNWTIVDKASGAVIGQVITSGSHPRFHGFAWDGDTMAARMVDRQGDPASERFDRTTGEWVDDTAIIDARLHARIDVGAGATRLRFITDVPGQAMTYERKEREARRYLDALPVPTETDTVPAPAEGEAAPVVEPVPDPMADLPFLAAEAEATEATPEDAARAIVAAADQWSLIGAAIEKARISAKRAVSAAATRAQKRAAALVDWDAVIEGAAP